MSDHRLDRTVPQQAMMLQDRRKICENRVFSVYLDHLRDASGSEIPDYLVVQPKRSNGDLVSGVSVLPFLGDRIGLLLVYRHAIGRPMWEVPRGFVDAGET